MDGRKTAGKMDKVREYLGLSEQEMSNALSITIEEYRKIISGMKELSILQVVMIHRLVRMKTDKLLT